MIHYRAEKMKNAAKSLWLLFAQAFGVFGGWCRGVGFAKRGLGATGGRGAKQSFAGTHSQAELGNDRRTTENIRNLPRKQGGTPAGSHARRAAEVADIFIPLTRNENFGMTRRGLHSAAPAGVDRSGRGYNPRPARERQRISGIFRASGAGLQRGVMPAARRRSWTFSFR